MILKPTTRRQLGGEGLIVFWRDGRQPGQREGLACVVSTCPHPECAGQLVHVNGFVIDGRATAVSWDEDGLHVALSTGLGHARTALEEKMIAIVDPGSGETTDNADLPDATDPALLDWLASEIDGELLDVLYRFLARAKGYPPERRAADIDLDAVEEGHLAGFDELFEGVRPDEYLLGGRRYWTCIYLCPYADCDCHELRVAFFDDEAESGDTVGSVLLDLGAAEGYKILETAAECGAPEHLIIDLWALFERRYPVGLFLRRREAQAKAVGATLWYPVAKPVRAAPKPGRNDPCPCGSGLKHKKCCLGKDREPSSSGGPPRSTR